MSAKRQRSKPRSKRAGDAIPAEILAEGSGPNEVVDATPQTLVEAAEDLVDKRKSRKRKAKAADADTSESAASDLTSDDASIEAASEGELDAAGDESGDAEGAEAEVEASNVDEVEGLEPVEALEVVDDENPDDAVAFDAAAGNSPPDTTMSAEGDSVAAVEEAIMRAEAEAELGDAEDVEAEASEEGELGAALPTTAASMDAAQLKNLVEALVFAADKPVTLQRLRQLTRVGDVKRLEQALTELAADYTSRGLVLQQVSGGYQFRTNTQYSVWVQQLIAGRPVRLSRAQLETLAIVAYRQPITRPEIDEIRGVDSSATLRLLLDRALIRTLGKKEDVGRPMLYGTTKEFLDFFSLGDLRELPTLREYSELTAESRKVMTDRLGVDPAAEPANDEAAEAVEAKPVVEVDAWGQVINIPDEEPAVSAEDSSAPTEELSTAEADSSVDSTVSDENDELSADGDELSTDGDELSAKDMSDDSVEMSASTEADADADDDVATPSVQVDAWGQVISISDDESDAASVSSADVSAETDELSASEDAMSADDEQSASGELSVSGGDVSAETDELSASEDATSDDDEQSVSGELSVSGGDVSAETDELAAALDASAETDEADLGAPAGGSMEDRIDLAGVTASARVEDALSDDDESGEEPTSTDDESLLATADDIVAGEDGEVADDASSDEPSRD